MKTNWQSYLELTEGLLAWIDACIEEAWLMREDYIDGPYVKAGKDIRFAANIGCVQALLSVRELILRDLGEW